MRIAFDRKRCEGFGMCEQAAPALYRLDDDANLIVRFEDAEVPTELEPAAEAGANACPVAALRVHR